MLACTQDGGNQSGQAGAGTHLQEGADTGCMHGFDLGHEFHRPGQLVRQQGLGLGLVGRILGRDAVGKDRNAGSMERPRFEGRLEGNGGVRHQAAVEGRRNRELCSVDPFFAEERGCPPDLGTAAGQDSLQGGVAVGDHQLQPRFGDDALHRCQGGLHRQHAPPVAASFGHQAAAQAGQLVERCLVVATGGAEGGQFAVAVTGYRLGENVERLKDPQGGQADRADGRLGRLGGPQLVFPPFPGFGVKGAGRIDQVGEEPPVPGVEAAVGRGQSLQCLGKAAGQVPEHTGVLGPLAGEEHGQAPRLFTPAEEGAVGRVPGRVRFFGQHGPGIGHQRGRFGPALLQHQGQAAGGRRVEGGTAGGRHPSQVAPGSVDRHAVQGPFKFSRISSGEGDDLHVSVPLHRFLAGTVLFQHQMEVGTAEAEGADAGAARRFSAGEPGAFLRCQVEGGCPAGHFPERICDLDGGGEHLVVQGQGRLDQAGGAGGGLGVADL